MSDANDLREHLTAFGQSHLLQFWEELDETERGELASQLRSFDIPQLVSQFKVRVCDSSNLHVVFYRCSSEIHGGSDDDRASSTYAFDTD